MPGTRDGARPKFFFKREQDFKLQIGIVAVILSCQEMIGAVLARNLTSAARSRSCVPLCRPCMAPVSPEGSWVRAWLIRS